MQNLIKTITNRYFKSMPDKRFHIYLTHDRINICWVRSVSNASMNYSKTFLFNNKDINKLIEWMLVTTGFPKAKIQLEIEAPFNNQKDLIERLSRDDIKVTIK